VSIVASYVAAEIDFKMQRYCRAVMKYLTYDCTFNSNILCS